MWHQYGGRLCLSAYKTASIKALQAIAAVLPKDLSIEEATNLYNAIRKEPGETRKTMRTRSLVEWQQRWKKTEEAAKWTRELIQDIAEYLKATIDYDNVYSRTGKPNFRLKGCTDADFGGDLDTKKSRSGYIFLLNESPVTWASERQQVVAPSTTEAEYIASSVGVE
ncbi:hypothetical protein JTB14_019904 [Gonioctena quinquepunctata]|nr:hypothetical protein JTB14_019904 [Gonioctena quinquepunctata]